MAVLALLFAASFCCCGCSDASASHLNAQPIILGDTLNRLQKLVHQTLILDKMKTNNKTADIGLANENKRTAGSETKSFHEFDYIFNVHSFYNILNKYKNNSGAVTNLKYQFIEKFCYDQTKLKNIKTINRIFVFFICSLFNENMSKESAKYTKNNYKLLNHKRKNHMKFFNNYVFDNKTSSKRLTRSVEENHEYQGFYPHLYPYQDESGIKALQGKDDTYYHVLPEPVYIEPSSYEAEKPVRYIQVYPGAFQQEYSYTNIPRTYWMFHFFKSLFAIWEALQTLAIAYLFWKVSVLKILPGRENEETNFLSWGWNEFLGYIDYFGSLISTRDDEKNNKLISSDISSLDSTKTLFNQSVDGEFKLINNGSLERTETNIPGTKLYANLNVNNLGRQIILREERTENLTDGPLLLVDGKHSKTKNIAEYSPNGYSESTSENEILQFINEIRTEWKEHHVYNNCISCLPSFSAVRNDVISWNNSNNFRSTVAHLYSSSSSSGPPSLSSNVINV